MVSAWTPQWNEKLRYNSTGNTLLHNTVSFVLILVARVRPARSPLAHITLCVCAGGTAEEQRPFAGTAGGYIGVVVNVFLV